jgi:hypothetical protein
VCVRTNAGLSTASPPGQALLHDAGIGMKPPSCLLRLLGVFMHMPASLNRLTSCCCAGTRPNICIALASQSRSSLGARCTWRLTALIPASRHAIDYILVLLSHALHYRDLLLVESKSRVPMEEPQPSRSRGVRLPEEEAAHATDVCRAIARVGMGVLLIGPCHPFLIQANILFQHRCIVKVHGAA